MTLRTFTIQRKLGGEYWLTGAPRNWRQGDAWLVAHDVFHHLEDDDGSVAREVMSFGVEAWLEAPKNGIANAISPGTMAGTLEGDFDDGVTSKRLARLVLPSAPRARFPSLPPEVREFFRLFAKDALEELVRNLEVYRDDSLPVDARADILAADNQRRCAHWLMYGFLTAQQRYPDAGAFQQAFELLQDCVKQLKGDEAGRYTLTRDAVLVAENKAAARGVDALLAMREQHCAHLRIKPSLLKKHQQFEPEI